MSTHPSLWFRFTEVVLRVLDVLPRLADHFIGATRESDNVTPSSARVNGTLIILTILLLQAMIIGVLCWKILTLDPGNVNAATLLPIYVRALNIFLLWALLFDVATALSLYGINVWRWVAAIRTGAASADDEGEASDVPKSIPQPAAHVQEQVEQAVPPHGQVD